MEHKQFKSKISDYVDKKLADAELVDFDKHALVCPACLLELQMTIKAVKEMKRTKAKEQDLPVNFYAKLGQKLDAADADKIKRKSFIYTPWLRAAALSFAVIFTVVMVRQITRSPEYMGNKGYDKSAAISAELPKDNTRGNAGFSRAGKKDNVKKKVVFKTASKQKKAEMPELEEVRAYDMAKTGPSTAASGAVANYNAPAAEPVMEAAPKKKAAPSMSMALGAGNDMDAYETNGDRNGPLNMVIKDKETWRTVARDSVINVDFTKQMILYVSLGEKPTAGYSVVISGVKYGTNKIQVFITQKSPQPGAVTAQIITYPVCVKVIDKSDLPVEFVFSK